MKGAMLCVAVLLIIGCADKPGRGILEEKQMMNVMWDLMQADEFATSYVSKDSLLDLKKERLKLYADVYRINGLEEKTFSESYKYYTAHPDLMKKIFDSLTTKGEKERQELYKVVAVKDSLKNDSIQAANRLTDSLKNDSIKKKLPAADASKKVKLIPDTAGNRGNQKAAKARQLFLMDSLRNARIRKTQKP